MLYQSKGKGYRDCKICVEEEQIGNVSEVVELCASKLRTKIVGVYSWTKLDTSRDAMR